VYAVRASGHRPPETLSFVLYLAVELLMKVNGVELAVNIEGDGMPFIWAHGLTLSMSVEDSTGVFDWPGCAGVCKCIRYDARGHGNSQGSLATEEYVWSGLAGDMIGIADGLGIDRFIAGGMSMGCATAVCAALSAPERVIGLVLVTPPTAWETRTAQAAIYNSLADIVETKGAVALQDLMRMRPLVPEWLLPTCPDAFEAHMKVMQALDAGVLAQIFRGAGLCNFPPRDEFKKLTMPVLILAWVGDATHPVSTAEELKALLPGSQLVVAGGVDDVKTWPGLIRDFIARLSR